LFSPELEIKEADTADVIYKVIILGDSGVGKTQFFNQWYYGEQKETNPSINVTFHSKAYDCDGIHVRVQLWDTAGQEKFRAIVKQYYRGVHGVVLIYSITEISTFQNVLSWIKDLEIYLQEKTPLLLVGNKSDQHDQRQVPRDDGVELARDYNMSFMETCAENGENCSLAMQMCLQEIHQLNLPKFAKKIARTKRPPSGPIGSSQKESGVRDESVIKEKAEEISPIPKMQSQPVVLQANPPQNTTTRQGCSC